MNPVASIADRITGIQKLICERDTKVREFIATKPQQIPCMRHPHSLRRISLKLSCLASARNQGVVIADYEACPQCDMDRAEAEIRERLHISGVPQNLLHATLANWLPDANNFEHSQHVRTFLEAKHGFLFLLGDVGTGKTHLAVGAMRLCKNPYLVKQNTLLRMLRQTYRDQAAIDPVIRCQQADLLVLDEMGLSSGGRDEFPLLNEVLDYRHSERKPTILAGNLDWAALQEIVGERLADRFRESTFLVLVFSGQSRRSEAREKYFSYV